ncbi:hypothetical protein [Shimia sediminis]|uniref:hypothetical protein n=1 Tax=Shimia sediminis TaxID=2497945 RepID=UPI000F8EF29A|nr:hypothetical protein [Shimia sediminis]
MSVFAELFLAVVTFFVQLLTELLSLVFSTSWMALHSRGMSRVAYAISAACTLHLFAALLLSFSASPQPVLLSWFFSWPAIIISGTFLLISLLVPTALAGKTAGTVVPTLVSYSFAFAIVLATTSAWSSQSSRTILIDAICDPTHQEMTIKALQKLQNEKVTELLESKYAERFRDWCSE